MLQDRLGLTCQGEGACAPKAAPCPRGRSLGGKVSCGRSRREDSGGAERRGGGGEGGVKRGRLVSSLAANSQQHGKGCL